MSVDRVEVVYRHIHPRLWRSLLAYGADAEIAADAVAEAFSQVLARGTAVRDVEAWVWRAAFRIASGMLAVRSSVQPLPAELGTVVDTSALDLVSQLQVLSEQQRAIVVLRYVGGLTPAEIAEVLDTSSGTVRVQLHRAHRSLRVVLEKPDGR